jgi:hypothetical protein
MLLRLVQFNVSLKKTDYTQITYTNNRTQTMTTEQNILFENARTGYELLQVLEDIMNDQSNIQTPTLVPMEF